MFTDPEILYRQLGRLLETIDVLSRLPASRETFEWLGRAHAAVHESLQLGDAGKIESITSWFSLADKNAVPQPAINTLYAILYRAFARAELKVPPGVAGAFIPVGSSFDAFAAITKLLSPAAKDVMIVDPYMDEVVLTDFATAVPEGVRLRLLADQQYSKPSLKPAAERWPQQYKNRPLAVRLAAPRLLHDRAIFIDGTQAWNLSQSFNAFAKRSPATILRADDIAPLKIAAYEAIWQNAAVLA